MALVTRGNTIGSTESVDETDLNTLVNSGTVTDIDRTDMRSADTSAVHIASVEPPSPSDDEFWYNTSLDILLRRDDANSVFAGWVNGFSGVTAVNLVAGDIVKPTTTASRDVEDAPTAQEDRVVGIAMETITSGNRGLFLNRGIIDVAKDPVFAVNLGDHVEVAGSLGCRAAGAKSTATFGICVEAAIDSATSVKCLIYL